MNERIDVVERPSLILPFDKDERATSASSPSEAIDSTAEVMVEEKTEWQKQDEEMESLYERFEHSKSDSWGWVQKHEVDVAKKRIRECLGFDPPPMAGWYMCVVVHEEKYARNKDGSKSNILLADQTIDNQKYIQCAGLVVSQGPECYVAKRFREHILIRALRKLKIFDKWIGPAKKKPWCRVGDWVMFPRHEGQMCNYRGIPMMMIQDVKIYSPIERPEYVTRGF